MQVCSCARACRRGAPARWPSAARSPTTPRASAPSASWRRRSSGELTRVRRSWLSHHLLADPALAEADRRAAALGQAAHATLLAACDRLGEISALLALRAYRHAAEAWHRFGAEGTGRWLALGERVATGDPVCRDGGLAYFAVPPAAASPRHARIVYRELPPATAKLPADVRGALLRALARIDPGLAAPLAELTPVAGAVLAEVPPAERLAALALVEEVAAAHSEAAVAALRVLPRLYEEASPAAIRRWFAAGAAVAAENAAAGRAYFAPEPRTSLSALRAAPPPPAPA